MKTLEQLHYAAVATVTLHQRERTLIIRSYRHGLTLHTIYYVNEIRSVKGYDQATIKSLKKQEIAVGEQFAKTLLRPFRPEELHDRYEERVKEVVESKANGKPAPKQEKAKRLAPVIDLMSALKKSLANAPASKVSRPRKLRRAA